MYLIYIQVHFINAVVVIGLIVVTINMMLVMGISLICPSSSRMCRGLSMVCAAPDDNMVGLYSLSVEKSVPLFLQTYSVSDEFFNKGLS